MFKKLLLPAAVLLFTNSASATGIYDPEIKAMHEQFGAYIRQSEKNIASLSKLTTAYERMGTAMENVANAKRRLRGKCPADSKEKLLTCLAGQFSAITVLDLYVRQGCDIMPDASADVREAGRILNQDVTEHSVKFKKITAGFNTWKDVTLPALKNQLDSDRQILLKLYGTAFVEEYRGVASRNEIEN